MSSTANLPNLDSTATMNFQADPIQHPDAEEERQGIHVVLSQLLEHTKADEIRIGDITTTFGPRAYGPLLLIPSIFVALPTGAIPGLPFVMACLIIPVAIQMIMKRETLWLPQFLNRFSLAKKRLELSINKFSWFLRFLDWVFRPRLEILLKGPMKLILAGQCIFFSICMIIFEVVPFAVIAPGFGMLFIALGITARDGLMIALSYLIFLASLAGTIALGVYIYFYGINFTSSFPFVTF